MSKKCNRLFNRRKRKLLYARKKRVINPELIQAARAAKLIRTICCCGPITMTPDRSRFRKLAKFILQQVIKSDHIHAPGKRNLLAGKLNLLEGYEMDQEAPLAVHLRANYTIHMDKFTGKMRIYFPALVPSIHLTCPDDHTHCWLTAVAASLDFDFYNATLDAKSSPVIPLTTEQVPAFSINLKVPPGQGKVRMLVLGIAYVNMNKVHSPLFHAVQILRVEHDQFYNAKLFIRKSDKLHTMNFDEEAPF